MTPSDSAARPAPVTLEGSCFCGAVRIAVTGEPAETGFCHCLSCRTHSGAPLVAYALFRDRQVAITAGARLLGSFNRTGASERCFCTRCGGYLMTLHPGTGFTDVSAPILRGLRVRPSVHLNYAEAVLPVPDGLPKFADFPRHAGGSGRVLSDTGAAPSPA